MSNLFSIELPGLRRQISTSHGQKIKSDFTLSPSLTQSFVTVQVCCRRHNSDHPVRHPCSANQDEGPYRPHSPGDRSCSLGQRCSLGEFPLPFPLYAYRAVLHANTILQQSETPPKKYFVPKKFQKKTCRCSSSSASSQMSSSAPCSSLEEQLL